MKFRILHYPELTSTNDLARELADQGLAEGAVICTNHQTKGRGRFERKWRSAKGKDLLFSILLRPAMRNNQASMITQIAARAVRDTLKEDCGLPAALKRPNDVLVNGKKICGILVEASAYPGRIRHVVVGIGLNVNSRRRELLTTATSVYELRQAETDRTALLESILKRFRSEYTAFLGNR